MARFGIVEEGEVSDIFLGWHAMGWWGRVSTEVVLVVVVDRIFGKGKTTCDVRIFVCTPEEKGSS